MKTPAKRRPWLRYSLRGLFLVTTVLCVYLALLFNHARRQRRAVEAILASGGVVMFDYHFQQNKKDADPPGPAWLRQLIGDELFRTPQHVELKGGKITDAFLAEHAAGLRGVKMLSIDSPHVTDRGLAAVARLPTIDILTINAPRITDEGLMPLVRLPKLAVLNLDAPQVTDAGMKHVARLTNLQYLGLGSPQVTAHGIEQLAPLQGLVWAGGIRHEENREPMQLLRIPRDIELSNVPLIDALEYLRETDGLPLDTDSIPDDVRLQPVTLVATNQLVGQSLEAILQVAGLSYFFERGFLKIVPAEEAASRQAGQRAFRRALPYVDRLEVDW